MKEIDTTKRVNFNIQFPNQVLMVKFIMEFALLNAKQARDIVTARQSLLLDFPKDTMNVDWMDCIRDGRTKNGLLGSEEDWPDISEFLRKNKIVYYVNDGSFDEYLEQHFKSMRVSDEKQRLATEWYESLSDEHKSFVEILSVSVIATV